tara:strand:+ start:48740 stop:48955 length:216 start_codon:yes stop_codon:yes gene_type:complete
VYFLKDSGAIFSGAEIGPKASMENKKFTFSGKLAAYSPAKTPPNEWQQKLIWSKFNFLRKSSIQVMLSSKW